MTGSQVWVQVGYTDVRFIILVACQHEAVNGAAGGMGGGRPLGSPSNERGGAHKQQRVYTAPGEAASNNEGRAWPCGDAAMWKAGWLVGLQSPHPLSLVPTSLLTS